MTTEAKHPYPPNYRPASHWAVDEAWTILDALPIGALAVEQRFLTAGRIAGTLLRVASPQQRQSEAVKLAALAAYHALKSYEFGNGSTDLASSTAAALKQALEATGTKVPG